MTRKKLARSARGHFGIGIYGSKTPANLGTLWRQGLLYGASYVFTVGKRYVRQCSDTPHTDRHIPLLHFTDVDDLVDHLPFGSPLVGVEMADRAVPLAAYQHRQRATYLLGAEDWGLPAKVVERCVDLVQIECLQDFSMNVSVAGGIVMYDRLRKVLQ